MKIWGVSEQEIRDSVAEVGLTVHDDWSGHGIDKDGRALRMRLSVNQLSPRNANGFLPYQRRSTSTWSDRKPRRIAAVCWHGHREFMRAVFRRNPEARIKTALADYRGADDFEQKFHVTFGKGNDYHLAYGQACDCPEDEHRVLFGTLTPTGLIETRMIRQADIQTCPHVIMVPEHYREDGSCRCDDPEHQKFMIAEWGYSPEDFHVSV